MIDAHVHVLAKASREFPREVSDTMPADREESAEKLLGLMEAHGVERATLVQIGGTSLETHAYLQHCLRRYPDRFKGIGLVPDPRRPEDHMDRLAEDGGIVGFRLHEIGGPLDPTAPMDVRTFTTYPFWKHAARKDYIVWLYPRAAEAHLTPWLLDAFPELTVVFNHLMICPAAGSMTTDEQGRPRMARSTFTNDQPLTRHNTLGLAQFPNVVRQAVRPVRLQRGAVPVPGPPSLARRAGDGDGRRPLHVGHRLPLDPGGSRLRQADPRARRAAAGPGRGGPRAHHGRNRAPHGLARVGDRRPGAAEVTSREFWSLRADRGWRGISPHRATSCLTFGVSRPTICHVATCFARWPDWSRAGQTRICCGCGRHCSSGCAIRARGSCSARWWIGFARWPSGWRRRVR